MGIKYYSIEKEFQHNKIESHGFGAEANEILGYENPIDIMYHSRELISEDNKWWTQSEQMVMEECCKHKFNNYVHARLALLGSKAELVEGTPYLKWGSSLSTEHTRDCLPDFWLGQNLMGKILMNVQKLLQGSEIADLEQMDKTEDCSSKHKGTSPLDHTSKWLQTSQ